MHHELIAYVSVDWENSLFSFLDPGLHVWIRDALVDRELIFCFLVIAMPCSSSLGCTSSTSNDKTFVSLPGYERKARMSLRLIFVILISYFHVFHAFHASLAAVQKELDKIKKQSCSD